MSQSQVASSHFRASEGVIRIRTSSDDLLLADDSKYVDQAMQSFCGRLPWKQRLISLWPPASDPLINSLLKNTDKLDAIAGGKSQRQLWHSDMQENGDIHAHFKATLKNVNHSKISDLADKVAYSIAPIYVWGSQCRAGVQHSDVACHTPLSFTPVIESRLQREPIL